MDDIAQGLSVRVLANMVAGVAAESTEHALDEMHATGIDIHRADHPSGERAAHPYGDPGGPRDRTFGATGFGPNGTGRASSDGECWMRRWRCVVTIAVVVAAVVGLVLSAFTVIPEYERAVFFRLGHLRSKGVSPWSS